MAHKHDDTTVNGEGPVEPVEASYSMPAPLTPEDAERYEKAHRAGTAFLVVIEPDGTSWATPDVNMDVVLARPATPGDMYRACSEVLKDLAATTAAQQAVQLFAQVFPQVQAQYAELERQNKIARKLASQGIHVPGR